MPVERRGFDPVRYRARVILQRTPEVRKCLGTFKTREQAQACLDEWIRQHPDQLVRRYKNTGRNT